MSANDSAVAEDRQGRPGGGEAERSPFLALCANSVRVMGVGGNNQKLAVRLDHAADSGRRLREGCGIGRSAMVLPRNFDLLGAYCIGKLFEISRVFQRN